MESYKVFYHNGVELGAYTVKGHFDEEEEWTKNLLATVRGIKADDIKVFIEER